MTTRILWTVVGTLALMVMGAPVRGQSFEVVDFEDHLANPPGSPGEDLENDFYGDRGIRFGGGTVLQYEEGFAGSGSNGLEMCYAIEFCDTPFQMEFDSGQRTIAVTVGYSGTLEEPASVLMVAFDGSGALLDSDQVLLGSGSPVPVGPQLVVDDPDGRIVTVEVRWSDDEERFMDSLVIDDVVFEPFVPVIEFSSQPERLVLEAVELAESSGQIVVTNDGNVAVPLRADLDGETGTFELVETTCERELAPGESCVIVIRFSASESGAYEAAAVLLPDPNQFTELRAVLNPEPFHTIPILGQAAVAPTSTTATTTATATTTTSIVTTTTAASTTTAPTTTEIPVTSTVPPTTTTPSGGGGPNAGEMLALMVAIGGGALLILPGRRRFRQLISNLGPEPPPQRPPTVSLRRDAGLSRITTDQLGPVTAIRVSTDRGGAAPRLTEEEDPS